MRTSSPRWSIGIDVGGTRTRVAAVSDGGEVLLQRHMATREITTGRALVEALAVEIRGIRGALGESNARLIHVVRIGLAVPGPLDFARGVVVRSVNVPFLAGFPLRAAMTEALGVDTHLCTDAEAATWAEYRACEARTAGFAHLRLGTGVACGVMHEGRLVPTDPNRRHHLDVLIVDPSPTATLCRCGLRGCLETIASGRALTERWGATEGSGDVSGLCDAWRNGNPAAQEIVAAAWNAVATAMARINREWSVPHFALGGGVVHEFPELIAGVRAAVKRTDGSGLCVEKAKLGDDAGVIGAACWARSDEFC